MIVMMDMASGSRLDEEESLSFAKEMPNAGRVPQPTPQLGLQLAVPELAPRPVLREPPRDAEESLRIVYLH